MHRSVLTDPAIEILDDVEPAPYPTVSEPDAVWVPVADSVRRFADRTGEGVDRAMFSWHRRLARMARAGNIRAQSRLRVYAWASLPDLLERLGDHPIEIDDRHRRLLTSEGPLHPWKRGAHRTEATLSLRWSWPDLPVWVVAEPWWREHTMLTISLRTTNRWRYPRRYWDGAHRALRGLVLNRPT